MCGDVSGNPDFQDGVSVTTSTVRYFGRGAEGNTVIITRNNLYILGEENPDGFKKEAFGKLADFLDDDLGFFDADVTGEPDEM